MTNKMVENLDNILEQNNYIFLGSRLKRLADWFLNDAAFILSEMGLNLFPSQTPILALIAKRGTISVSEIAIALKLTQPAISRNLTSLEKLGYIEKHQPSLNRRQIDIKLTLKGEEIYKQLNEKIMQKINIIVGEMCENLSGNLLEQITQLEENFHAQGFAQRYFTNIEILEYSPELAKDFYKINAQWIEETFCLEEIDKYVLSNPEAAILKNGGKIFFAKTEKLGIIGTCALMKIEDGVFELTKMGVLKSARGLKIGEKLLAHTISHAKSMKIPRLFLLTNKKAEAAIHLYEKLGFIHSQEIMDKYGAEYERCNVAMLYAD